MRHKHWFWAIIVVAVMLRFYKLGIIPFGYNWDETSIIYNSWGIALWHRDEWANLMPLAFRSFGDYKAPLLFYMLAVPFKLFGLILPLIRIYSAIAGVITVVAAYFISKQLFPKSPARSLVAMLLVAVSPWAVNFSRVGFEANIGLALVSCASALFLYGLKKPKFWILSSILFSLSLYAYHSTKIFLPLMLVSIAILYQKTLKKSFKLSALSTLVFVCLVSPLIYVTFFGNGFERGLTMIFFDDAHQVRSVALISKELWQNLLNQFSSAFLIGGKDAVGLRHLTPGSGILYAIELPLFLFGFIRLLQQKSKSGIFLISWVIIGQVPALLTHQTPHAVRSLLMIPALQIITAVGIENLLLQSKQKSRLLYKVTGAMLVILFTGSLGQYLKSYYTEYAVGSALDFQFGYQEALEKATQLGKSKEKIVVTDKYGQPYVYVLLHNRIKPEEFLAGALANYEFHSFSWPYFKPNSIIVGTPAEIPPNDAAVKEVIYIPGTNTPVFVIAETPTL